MHPAYRHIRHDLLARLQNRNSPQSAFMRRAFACQLKMHATVCQPTFQRVKTPMHTLEDATYGAPSTQATSSHHDSFALCCSLLSAANNANDEHACLGPTIDYPTYHTLPAWKTYAHRMPSWATPYAHSPAVLKDNICSMSCAVSGRHDIYAKHLHPALYPANSKNHTATSCPSC
jgi:hypothetical protein